MAGDKCAGDVETVAMHRRGKLAPTARPGVRGGSQEEPEGELTPEEVDILIGAALPGDEGLRFAPVAAALPACHRAARHATAWTG